MNSSRRGFLNLLGGGAIAGPKAVKQAFAKAGATGLANMPSVGGLERCTPGPAGKDDQSWRAREVLALLRDSSPMPSKSPYYDERYPNIEALVSVSETNKHRMTVEIKRERALANSIRDLLYHYKLDWIGLSEEQLIVQIERIAGDRP